MGTKAEVERAFKVAMEAIIIILINLVVEAKTDLKLKWIFLSIDSKDLDQEI